MIATYRGVQEYIYTRWQLIPWSRPPPIKSVFLKIFFKQKSRFLHWYRCWNLKIVVKKKRKTPYTVHLKNKLIWDTFSELKMIFWDTFTFFVHFFDRLKVFLEGQKVLPLSTNKIYKHTIGINIWRLFCVIVLSFQIVSIRVFSLFHFFVFVFLQGQLTFGVTF